jgi:ferrous-iron efflux pump FieF
MFINDIFYLMKADSEHKNSSIKWLDQQSPKHSILLFLVLSFFVLSWCFIISFLTGSIGFLSFGVISLAFFISKIFFMGAVKKRLSAPLEFQNYGTGKHWSLSVFISIILFSANAAFIIFLILIDYSKNIDNTYFFWGIFLSLFSSISAYFVWQYQKRSFKSSNFEILKYDSSDSKEYFEFLLIFTVLMSIAQWLINNSYFEPNVIDSIIAFSFSTGVALNSFKNLKEAIFQLLDKPVSEDIQFNVIAAVSENINMMCEFRAIHTRKSGGDVFIEIDVILPNDHTLDQCKALEDNISKSLKNKHPEAQIRLYASPCKIDCIYGSTQKCPIGKTDKKKELKNE